MNRRSLFAAGAGLLAAPAIARAQAPHHGLQVPTDQMRALRGATPQGLTEAQLQQRIIASPAPAGAPGRWEPRAPLPIPRTEMAWAAESGGKLHVIGGYAEQVVNMGFHHVYDPATNSWAELAALPRGANHVGVAADGQGRIYALGGFSEQNRAADTLAFVYTVADNRWERIAPMPRPRGAGAVAIVNGLVWHIGGATDPSEERASIAWNEVYDPRTDRWERRRALPAGRDHAGVGVYNGRIHIVGGRFNTFETNTGLHHVYDPQSDIWRPRAPLPSARSGHGMCWLNGRFWCMGGEGRLFDAQNRQIDQVFGTLESYDPVTDSWASHAPMPIPRHGMGAVTIGEWIYVAGGGPIVGGGIKTSVHEAYRPG